MDPGDNAVPAPTLKGGEVLVGDQKAGRQMLPTSSQRPVKGIDWTSVFAKHPELSPPGYEEAVSATLESVEQRKLLRKQSQEEKKSKGTSRTAKAKNRKK